MLNEILGIVNILYTMLLTVFSFGNFPQTKELTSEKPNCIINNRKEGKLKGLHVKFRQHALQHECKVEVN